MRKLTLFIIIFMALLFLTIIIIGGDYLDLLIKKPKVSFVIASAFLKNPSFMSSEVYLCIINTGEVPVLINSVTIFKDIVDSDHYIGECVYQEHVKASLHNRLFILNGSNPVPPNHKACFRGILACIGNAFDETGVLKPGLYIIRVRSNTDVEAYYSLNVKGAKLEVMLQGFSYNPLEQTLKISLIIKNIGDLPFFLYHDVNAKVFIDGKPHPYLISEFKIEPGEKKKLIIQVLNFTPHGRHNVKIVIGEKTVSFKFPT